MGDKEHMKITSLRIGQKVKFYSNKKQLIGTIICIGRFTKRDYDGKDYICEVEVDKIDKKIENCWDGTYQLREEEIKEIK